MLARLSCSYLLALPSGQPPLPARPRLLAVADAVVKHFFLTCSPSAAPNGPREVAVCGEAQACFGVGSYPSSGLKVLRRGNGLFACPIIRMYRASFHAPSRSRGCREAAGFPRSVPRVQ